MKARHKDTGEIIELAEEGIISSDGRRFCWYQVELIPEPIDDFKPSLPSTLEESEKPSEDLEEAAEISKEEGIRLQNEYIDYLAKGLKEGWERPIGAKWMMEFAKKKFIEGARWNEEQSKPKMSEDVEEEIKHYTEQSYHDTFNEQGTQDEFDWDDIAMVIEDTARHFAEWQKEQDDKALHKEWLKWKENLFEDIKRAESNGYDKGKADGIIIGKEQMMKGAVEARVFNVIPNRAVVMYDAYYPNGIPTNDRGVMGKLIFVKEEGK